MVNKSTFEVGDIVMLAVLDKFMALRGVRTGIIGEVIELGERGMVCVRFKVRSLELKDWFLPDRLNLVNHQHTLKTYIGFTETYDYCTECGEKNIINQSSEQPAS